MKKLIDKKYLTHEVYKDKYSEYNEMKEAKGKDDSHYYNDNIEMK